MTAWDVPVLSADDVTAALPPRAAVAAVRDALLDGLDPAADPARSVVPTGAGQILLMPSSAADVAGVKVATVAPGNPARGLPRIQAAYLLFDGATLALRAVLDGTALTTLRTPAVSVAAVLPLLQRDPAPLRVVLLGAGPQAVGHVHTLRDALAGTRPLGAVTFVVRSPDRLGPRPAEIAAAGVLAAGTTDVGRALAAADVVVCATTARTPLFDSTALSDRCVVIAVGSHEPDAREVDAAFLARAQVVVEDVATALREAGDVVLAVSGSALDPATLVSLRQVVTGAVRLADDRPVVFKSTGMAWEDLVVARAVLAAHLDPQDRPAPR